MPSYSALSIVAPHGESIVNGRKTLEVRSWHPPTFPLLDLVIVENKRYLQEDGEVDPQGEAVALVDVVSVEPWTPDQVEAACSSGWVPGYYAWRLSNVRRISGRPTVPAERKVYQVHVECPLVTKEVSPSNGSLHLKPKVVPEALEEHILPFNWDVRKVWAIDADVLQLPCSEFAYLLELPLWSSVPGQGMLFDIRPIDVIRNPNASPYQAQRLRRTDLRYPVDMLVFQGRRWVLDGVHRIAKHFILDSPIFLVRFHDESTIPAIKVG